MSTYCVGYKTNLDKEQQDVIYDMAEYLENIGSVYDNLDEPFNDTVVETMTEITLPYSAYNNGVNYLELYRIVSGTHSGTFFYFATPEVVTLNSVTYSLQLDAWATFVNANSSVICQRGLLTGGHYLLSNYTVRNLNKQRGAEFEPRNVSRLSDNVGCIATVKYHLESGADEEIKTALFLSLGTYTTIEQFLRSVYLLTDPDIIGTFRYGNTYGTAEKCILDEISGIYVIPEEFHTVCRTLTGVSQSTEATVALWKGSEEIQEGYFVRYHTVNTYVKTATCDNILYNYYIGNSKQLIPLSIVNATQYIKISFSVSAKLGSFGCTIYYDGKATDFTTALNIGANGYSYSSPSLSEKISAGISVISNTAAVGAGVASIAGGNVLGVSSAASGLSGIANTIQSMKTSSRAPISKEDFAGIWYTFDYDGTPIEIRGIAFIPFIVENSSDLTTYVSDFGEEYDGQPIHNLNIIAQTISDSKYYNKTYLKFSEIKLKRDVKFGYLCDQIEELFVNGLRIWRCSIDNTHYLTEDSRYLFTP